MESINLLIFFRAACQDWAVDCYLHGDFDQDNIVIVEATAASGTLNEKEWLSLLDSESLASSFWQEVSDQLYLTPSECSSSED